MLLLSGVRRALRAAVILSNDQCFILHSFNHLFNYGFWNLNVIMTTFTSQVNSVSIYDHERHFFLQITWNDRWLLTSRFFSICKKKTPTKSLGVLLSFTVWPSFGTLLLILACKFVKIYPNGITNRHLNIVTCWHFHSFREGKKI